jgi:hypothetical protein
VGSNRILTLIRDSDDDRRDQSRRRVLLSAQLHTSSTVYRVRIRDVSEGGAKIEGENLPAPGVVVCLQRGDRAAYGAMAWVNGQSGGVEFDEPVEDDYFGGERPGAMTASAAAAATEPYRRPGFGPRVRETRYSTGDGWIDPSSLGFRR